MKKGEGGTGGDENRLGGETRLVSEGQKCAPRGLRLEKPATASDDHNHHRENVRNSHDFLARNVQMPPLPRLEGNRSWLLTVESKVMGNVSMDNVRGFGAPEKHARDCK